MAQPQTKTAKTAVAKKPAIFNIRRNAPESNGTTERVLAGTLQDYLVDSEELSLSDNVNYPVMNIKTDQAVTLKINYEGTTDYGLLWFSRPLSAKLRNKSIKLADMLNYPIQEQPIFQDIDNTIPLISDETGEQVVKYIISNPEGGSRVKIKTPVAPAKSNVASVSDVW